MAGEHEEGGEECFAGLAGESYCGLIVHGDYEWIVFLSRQVRAGSRLASARQKVLSDNTLHHDADGRVQLFSAGGELHHRHGHSYVAYSRVDVLNICGNYLLIFGKFGFPEPRPCGRDKHIDCRDPVCCGNSGGFAMRKRYRVYWRSVVGSHAEGRRRYRVWVTSYPLMIQSGVECGLWSFGAVVSGWFGKVQLATYQVMNTIAQLGYMTYMGFGWLRR